jgi:hypothetical protein
MHFVSYALDRKSFSYILDCLREDQDTKEEPKNWQVPEVDFLSNRHPAKFASEKPEKP